MRSALTLSCLLGALALTFGCGGRPSSPDGGVGGSGGGASGGGTGGTGGTGGGATGGGAGGGGSATTPTWYRDVLPLTQAHCQSCHTSGGIGPFALDTYAQAQPVAAAMASAVATGSMPPWMPSSSCGTPFVGERRLTPAAIDTIVAWNAGGAPAGNPADAPPAPDAGVAGLPRVDVTLAMPAAYTPSASLTDDYRCFVVDPHLAQATFVTGYDIQPDVRAQVHHVILYVANRADALAADANDATPGWPCFGGPGVTSDGALGAWAPGSDAVVLPTGLGVRIQPAQVLAMQVHYNTSSGSRLPDRSSVRLMYAQGAVTNTYLLPLTAAGFAIPPNSTGYTYTRPFPNSFGVPLKIWGLLPHMHTLGARISIHGANNECLIDIPKWDFHWQQSYFRTQPHVLPTSASLTLACTWDNPTNRTVTWGDGTADEMCFAYVYASP